MKHKSKTITASLIVAVISVFTGSSISFSRENVKNSSIKVSATPPSILAVCGNPTAQTDLEINNVRCKLQTAGDMWWDFTTQVGRYEIPKNSNKFSIYAGALWVGGYDQGGQLRLAGQEYGHSSGNNDFWPGPLNTTNASVNDTVCNKFDKHFSITRKEVEEFATGQASITQSIKDWPGNGDPTFNQDNYLAPFVDGNADGIYNPNITYVDPIDGVTKPYDYPKFDLAGTACGQTNCIPNDILYGDQLLWWVFNDKGDIHGNTGGAPIGLEIRAQAFGFSTNDAINDMTFYNYRIINRSSYQLDTCYFGVWCDADLGNYQDDYVGCDVSKGLGYTYNSDEDDEISAQGYGIPPAVGIDFFQGPITNPVGVLGDGIDNDRDGLVDESCEQAIMSKFVYYTNGGGFPMQDPVNAVEYYNYLSGRWQDGSRWTYGGNGNGGGTNPTTIPADFCYPGNSDHDYEWGTGGSVQTPGAPMPDWYEDVTCTNNCDRRMMQSAGPFTLLPGAVNVITTGVVWAQGTSRINSVEKMLKADKKAQALFDGCFKITNGPDAPDLIIQELDRKLNIYLYNAPGSNNYAEHYPYVPGKEEKDPNITSGTDTAWIFQGYKLYQLKDASVSAADLNNTDKARPVGIYDIKDGVTKIINYYDDIEPNPGYWTPQLMVNAPDNGLQHTITVTKDLFASGDPTLINHKTYYFMAVAFAYNPGEVEANPAVPVKGDNKPYLEGRNNVMSYSAIPHINTHEQEEGEYSYYGDTLGIQLTRIEGNGNGGNVLDFTASTVDSILASPNSLFKTPEYESGRGPISNFKVIDPLNVSAPTGTTFTFWFVPDTSSTSNTVNIANSKWKLKNNSTGDTITSDQTISVGKQQLFPQWGVSLTIKQVTEPGSSSSSNNGFLEASMSSNSWLTGFADSDSANYSNWIRSGTETADAGLFMGDYITPAIIDKDEHYEGVIGGTWAPYRLCANSNTTPLTSAKYYGGPGWKGTYTNNTLMSDLASVDVVFTSDKNKWTRCVVLETSDDSAFTEHLQTTGANNNRGGLKLGKRRGYSVDKNGNSNPGGPISTNPNDPNFIDSIGMGWFPGYAINLETGERLNVCFGENSALTKSVGAISYNTLTGIFQTKEVVTSTSGGTGIVVTNNGFTIRIKNINGSFNVGDVITGGTSGATATVSKYSTFEQNGRDMKWNPTSNVYGENPWDSSGAGPVLGGMHFIYVFGHNRETSSGTIFNLNISRYDNGRKIDSLLNTGSPYGFPLDVATKRKIFRDAMWVNIPLLSPGQTLLFSDVTVRLRVAKPYKKGYSPSYSAGIPASGDTIYADTAAVAQNNNYPMYTFKVSDLKTHTIEHIHAPEGDEALNLINVVPNPYYAYSAYETSVLDNRVKITNLPSECTVSIYNLSGTLIRKYKKSELSTNHTSDGFPGVSWFGGSLDWDLKNSAGIPISSGVYIIHVDAPGIGEKVLKWFGVMRPIDLDSF